MNRRGGQREEKIISQAPEGWKTNLDLEKELDTWPNNIKRIVYRYKKSHPEYFYTFKHGKTNKEYYAPALVEIIKEKIFILKETSEPPEGWDTNSNISEKHNIPYRTIANRADIYRKEHPEYFGIYKNKIGHVVEYYAPVLVQLILEDLEKFKKISSVPEGWETKESLKSKIGIGGTTLNNLLQYLPSVYAKEYKNKSGIVHIYYAPESIPFLDNLLHSKDALPPEGWVRKDAISNKTNLSSDDLEMILRKYRKKYPHNFKKI